MRLRLAVLVDNRELIRFLRVDEGASGVINLTTMIPNQDRARVELHLVSGRRQMHVHTFEARDILRGREHPEIVLSAHVRGSIHASLRIEGELVAEQSIGIPDSIPREREPGMRLGWALLAILGLAIVAGGVWWYAENGAENGVTPPAATEDPAQADSAVAASPEDPAPALPANPPQETVYFEPESAVITAATERALTALAELIARDAEVSSLGVVTIDLTGHTALYGNEEARIELSRERAVATRDELVSRLEERVPELETRISAAGGTSPITREEELQWQNRRVVIGVAYSTHSTEID